jgi:hypothetical protein
MALGSLRNWCTEHGGLLAGLVVGLAFIGWGAVNCLASLGPPERLSVTVADLEAGKRLPGKWLEITGRLLSEDRIIWPPGGVNPSTYVPLVSESWQKTQPVSVYVRAREENWLQPGRLLKHPGPSVIGMADRSGLDPDLAEKFTEFEMPPATNAIILDWEEEPITQTLGLGYIGLGIGGTVLVITGLVWLVQRFRLAPVPLAEGSHE